MTLTHENKADRPTPTPIQKSGDPLHKQSKFKAHCPKKQASENYVTREHGW